MSLITIAAVKEQAGETPLAAAIVAQLQSRSTRTTKAGKPYLELTFADSTGNFILKIWSDTPAYERAASVADSAILRLEAEWTQNQYGINAGALYWAEPDAEEISAFLAGDPRLRQKQDADFAEIQHLCASLEDPRLGALCDHFFTHFGERFRRTAAARKNHHARRGGLVEHVAQMMRSANVLCPVYPELNRDLLIAGVLFHDCGKLWENSYAPSGFTQQVSLYGEMLGHIPLGIELVNKLWHDISGLPEAAEWADLEPATESVRLHLLHLIGSHHGQLEFGSPVLPRTPEAHALHYIDNLDAKMEMIREAYAASTEVVPGSGIYDRIFPLPANLVKPLPAFIPPPPAVVPE